MSLLSRLAGLLKIHRLAVWPLAPTGRLLAVDSFATAHTVEQDVTYGHCKGEVVVSFGLCKGRTR